jgi:hypothetical protein
LLPQYLEEVEIGQWDACAMAPRYLVILFWCGAVTDPLVVLVFTMANGGSEPAMPSMTAAARQALGANTVLLFEERAILPPDDEALAVAEHVRAGAVAELEWFVGSRTYAILHVHSAQRTGWVQRKIQFASTEPAVECGRTVGFTMASMITGLGASPSAPDRARPVAPEPPRPFDERMMPAPTDPQLPPPADRAAATPAAPFTAYRAVEAVGIGSAGGASDSNTFGGEVSGQASVLPWLALQLGAGVRFGDIAAAQATLWSVQVGGGATWRALTPSGPRPFELDLRVDSFATEILVHRAGESHSRWLPDARLSLEACWFFVTRNVGLVAAAGLDASFGTTAVAVGGDTVATIPPFRAIGALGVRTRF